MLVFASVHISGRKQTAHVQGWITALKLTVLVLFVVAGVVAGRSNFANLNDRPPITASTIEAMTGSLVWISYAYIGWNAASYLAGEFVDPQRKLPRDGAGDARGRAALSRPERGLRPRASRQGGPGDRRRPFEHALVPQGCGATIDRRPSALRREGLGTVVGGRRPDAAVVDQRESVTGPRVIYAMAVAGHFPAVAGRLTSKAKTPAVATVTQTIMTLAFLWFGTLASLVSYASVGLAIFSMMAVASVFVLRRRRPDLPRLFRTPGYPITPAIFLTITFALTLSAFKGDKALPSFLALLSILAGAPVYYVWPGSADDQRPSPSSPVA